jgi:hypothetical protein
MTVDCRIDRGSEEEMPCNIDQYGSEFHDSLACVKLTIHPAFAGIDLISSIDEVRTEMPWPQLLCP